MTKSLNFVNFCTDKYEYEVKLLITPVIQLMCMQCSLSSSYYSQIDKLDKWKTNGDLTSSFCKKSMLNKKFTLVTV